MPLSLTRGVWIHKEGSKWREQLRLPDTGAGQEGQDLSPPEGGQGYDMRYKFDDPSKNEEKSDYSIAK